MLATFKACAVPSINSELSEIFIMSNGTVFSNLVPFPFDHSLLGKMLKDHGKVANYVLSGCFKCRKLLHINKFNTYWYSKFFFNIYLTDSNTIYVWWEQLGTFLVEKCAWEVCKQSELSLRKFGTTSPQFSRKSDPNVENRQSKTGLNCGTLFCVQNDFVETYCSIQFWTGISGNVGRMEHALKLFMNEKACFRCCFRSMTSSKWSISSL